MIDPFSLQEFKPQRSNQRFSCPQNRVSFHNDKAKKIRLSKRFIDSKLHKNFIILSEIMDGYDERKFHREFLLGKGFTFGVVTHFDLIDDSNRPCFYEFTMIPNGDSVVVKRLKG
jgi:hypothetical protein